MRRDREWKLFLALCAPLSHEISDFPEPDEWARMLGRLEQTRFGALAYHNLRARGLDDAVPAQVMAHLRAEHAQALARYHLLGEMVSPHLEALAREVDFLVLKGTAWAHTVYPEPHLRQSGDIDLLVTEEDQVAAGKVLEERGFDCRRESVWADDGSTCTLASLASAVVFIELHPSICRPSRYPYLRGADVTHGSSRHRLWNTDALCLALEMSALHALFELAIEYRIGGYARYLVDMCHLGAASAFDYGRLDALVSGSGIGGLAYARDLMLGAAPARAPRPMAWLGAAGLEGGVSSPWARNGRVRGGLAAVCSLALWDRWDDRCRYIARWGVELLPRAVRKGCRFGERNA